MDGDELGPTFQEYAIGADLRRNYPIYQDGGARTHLL
jgi:hypothetical protein